MAPFGTRAPALGLSLPVLALLAAGLALPARASASSSLLRGSRPPCSNAALCAEARSDLTSALSSLPSARNASSLRDSLSALTSRERSEQHAAALDFEAAHTALVSARASYESEAAALLAEMHVVASCAEASHLAVYHALRSRSRDDPRSAQAALLRVATEKVECSQAKLSSLAPLRKKVLALRSALVAAQAAARAAEGRVRALIERQFRYADEQCEALGLREKEATAELARVLESARADAGKAVRAFQESPVIDDERRRGASRAPGGGARQGRARGGAVAEKGRVRPLRAIAGGDWTSGDRHRTRIRMKASTTTRRPTRKSTGCAPSPAARGVRRGEGSRGVKERITEKRKKKKREGEKRKISKLNFFKTCNPKAEELHTS